VVLAVTAVLWASSISAGVAHSQGAADPAGEPDDDATAGGGSAQALAAPADPKARVAWLRERVTAAIAAQPKLGKAKIAVSVFWSSKCGGSTTPSK